jgi:hypothetical protein
MDVTKKVTWTLRDGRIADCSITVEAGTAAGTVQMGGWNAECAKKPDDLLFLEISLDGACVARSCSKPSVIAASAYSQPYVDQITAAGGYAKVGDIVVTKDAYDAIITAIDEATSEAGREQDYAGYETQGRPEPVAEELTIPDRDPCPACGADYNGDCQASEGGADIVVDDLTIPDQDPCPACGADYNGDCQASESGADIVADDLTINGAWYVEAMLDNIVTELPDSSLAMFYLTPFRPITAADLTPYLGPHPRRCKGQPLPDYLYRFYGLVKNTESATEVIHVRVTPSEKAALETYAGNLDPRKSVSEVVRDYIRGLV